MNNQKKESKPIKKPSNNSSKASINTSSAATASNSLFQQQILSVLKLRLSIQNVPIEDNKITQLLKDYLTTIDINYIKTNFINKIVEDIFLQIKNEDDTIKSHSIQSTLSSITFNPLDELSKFLKEKPKLEPLTSKDTYLPINTDPNISKKSLKGSQQKKNHPMRFCLEKEHSDSNKTEPVFFLDNSLKYNGKGRYPKCSTQAKVYDVDIQAMNERIINEISTTNNKSCSS